MVTTSPIAAVRSLPRKAKTLEKGDYVLATKYRDGDPYDGYAVGFYDAPLERELAVQSRHLVVDADGSQYRGNGFRRVERISHDLGSWIVQHRVAIEALTHAGKPVNIWRFKYGGPAERQALERWATDEGREVVSAYAKRIAFLGRLREDEKAAYLKEAQHA